MTFRIALTGDFQKDGKIIYPDFDLTQLKNTDGIEYDFFDEHKRENNEEEQKCAKDD